MNWPEHHSSIHTFASIPKWENLVALTDAGDKGRTSLAHCTLTARVTCDKSEWKLSAIHLQ